MSTPSAGLVHQILLYEDVQHFLDEVLPFVREGIERGEPVLAVTTEVNTSALRDELGRKASDVRFVDPARWYDAPGRTMAACNRYLHEQRDGHDRVRVVGEPVWAGWSTLEISGWKRFEASLNLAFATAPAWMICSYDERALPESVVADARRTHPELSGGGKSLDFADPTGFCTELDTDFEPAPDGRYAALAFDGDPAPVRRFVAPQAANLGLSVSRRDDLVLAANEVTERDPARRGARAGPDLARRPARGVRGVRPGARPRRAAGVRAAGADQRGRPRPVDHPAALRPGRGPYPGDRDDDPVVHAGRHDLRTAPPVPGTTFDVPAMRSHGDDRDPCRSIPCGP